MWNIYAAVSIGNTDNKLSQQEWNLFVAQTNDVLKHYGKIHFFGGASNWEPWQNVAWIVEVAYAMQRTALMRPVLGILATSMVLALIQMFPSAAANPNRSAARRKMAILKSDIGLIQLEECPRCNYLVSWVDMKHENEKPVLCKWCAAEQSVHWTCSNCGASKYRGKGTVDVCPNCGAKAASQ